MSKKEKLQKDKPMTILVNKEPVVVDLNCIVEYTSPESLNQLVEFGEDYADDNESLEEAVIHSVMVDKLHHVIKTLTDSERELIYALFFSNDGAGVSERAYARSSGIPRKTIESRRKAVFSKIKQLL